MSYCLTPLPWSARKAIHGLLEGLDRVDYVRRHGGTPSAQAFSAIQLTSEEDDFDPDNATGMLFSTIKVYLYGAFCSCVAMGQPHCGHTHLRLHTVRSRAPCADCRLGGSCRLGGACVNLHTYFRRDFITLITYDSTRAMTADEWMASIRDPA